MFSGIKIGDIEMKFIDLLDKYLTTSWEMWQRKSHYASDANSCRRQLVYKWTMVPESDPPTAGNYLKMKFGGAAEWVVEECLKWAVGKDIIKDYETQRRNEQHIEGLKYPVVMKMDFIITDNDGAQEILEIKSSFGRGIKEIQKNCRPKDDHLMQTFLYANYENLPATIAYVARDNGYRTEFELRLRDTKEGKKLVLDGKPLGTVEEGVAWLVKRLAYVEDHLERKEIPPRDFVHAIKNGEMKDTFTHKKIPYKSDWHCVYCSWKTMCWKPMLPEYAEGHNEEMFSKAPKETSESKETTGQKELEEVNANEGNS